MKKVLLTTVLFFSIMAASFAKTRYTFHTTCGTTVQIISDQNWSDATLTSMMNGINEADCNETPGSVEIIR
ncbi:hypothetical protein FFJ24_008530 [Pedobacter sp. KBS0701]|uniref:hypothetical protein n=1 Tax=Pedobacter sp. KBS0701 TaxID=2578106 RepID=UPI00110E9AF6|nr:hypothetical protein [Pedobacter sp. KBS0701]QDW24854.1 hypothetical protein FFJ24_008530 [Pedobacter sp. KBS0701]